MYKNYCFLIVLQSQAILLWPYFPTLLNLFFFLQNGSCYSHIYYTYDLPTKHQFFKEIFISHWDKHSWVCIMAVVTATMDQLFF